MTDVSKLEALAKAISTASPKIRAYAIAQAGVSKSQEAELVRLAKEVELLRGSGGGTRPGDPPPDPPPPDPGPPPDPPPPAGGQGQLCICPNSLDGAYGTFTAGLHTKAIRQDSLSPGLVAWAASNNVQVMGLGGPLSLGLVNQYPTINLWEYDNEPYYRGVEINSYARAMRDFGIQFKAAHPTKTLIMPMYVQSDGGDWFGDRGWLPWVTYVFDAAPNIGSYYDGWGAHPYSSPRGGAPSLAPIQKIRNQLVARGFTKDCYVTEWGWSQGSGTDQVNSATHASYLGTSVDLFRTQTWIKQMYYYCSLSWGSGFEPGFGLFDATTNTERAAAAVFRSKA